MHCEFLSTLRHCAGEKVKNWHFCHFWQSVENFEFWVWIVCHLRKNLMCIHKKIEWKFISLIFYRLQLHCLDQIEENFSIITLHFFFTLLLFRLEQLINEPGLPIIFEQFLKWGLIYVSTHLNIVNLFDLQMNQA